MKTKHLAPFALAPAALLLALDAPDDTLEFRPAEGSKLSKAFETTYTFAVDDLFISASGEEIDPEMMGADMSIDDMNGEVTLTLEVVDHYVKMGDGRPSELVRSYDGVLAEYETGFGEAGEDSMQEIEGKRIRFQDDEEGGYSRSALDDEEIEEERLNMLAEDLDLRAFLPGRAVSPEDKWTVDWADLGGFLLPGIDPRLRLGELQDEDFMSEVPSTSVRWTRSSKAERSSAPTSARATPTAPRWP